MGSRISTRRLIGSVILAIAIVAFAYISTLPAGGFRATASGTDALLKELAQRDSDGDGLLDWEEALYGTDPQNPNSASPDMLDSEAVARGLVSPKPFDVDSHLIQTSSSDDIPGAPAADGSLTEQFAEALFSHITRASEAGLKDSDKDALVSELLLVFQENSSVLFKSRYTITSLNIATQADVETYVSTIESILFRSDTAEGNADIVALATAAIENNDLVAKESLGDLVRFYVAVAADLAQTPVPPTLADTHLALVQSLDVAAIAIASLTHVDTDPLIALAAVSVLNSGPVATVNALRDIVGALTRVNGTPATNMPGHMLREAVNSIL